MFKFAKYVLGPVYVLVFLVGILLAALLLGPVVKANKPVGIVLLLMGVVASMYVASAAKEFIRRRCRKDGHVNSGRLNESLRDLDME